MKDFDFFRGFDFFRRDIDQMFEAARKLARPSLLAGSVWHPPVDVVETPNEVIVIMEIAGARKEDITVTLEGDALRISGTRCLPKDIDVTRLHRVELDFGEFERFLRLPGPLNGKKISAAYRDGFLKVVIPKDLSGKRSVEIREE